MIPFLDLKKQYLQIKPQVLQAVEEVYDSTAFTGGKYVEAFEKEFAAYCQTAHAVAVNSGTSALHLALCALDIKAGDEVIIPANTFIATAWAVSYVGATPVFVDCMEGSWGINPERIEAAITPKTKAIIGVHLYGQSFEVEQVSEVARKHGLFLIEDAAQAHGALYKGAKIGSLSDIACFSFYPGKNLGTYGEGGAITTDSEIYAKRIAKLRNHASEEKYYHTELGFNMRMGGAEAAILSIKLQYIDQWNARRQNIAAKYLAEIRNPKVSLPKQLTDCESVYHLFVVLPDDREQFQQHLTDQAVGSAMHYPVPCHLQKAYAHLGCQTGDFPVSEHLAAHCVSLPMFAELTDSQVQQVIDAVNSY